MWAGGLGERPTDTRGSKRGEVAKDGTRETRDGRFCLRKEPGSVYRRNDCSWRVVRHSCTRWTSLSHRSMTLRGALRCKSMRQGKPLTRAITHTAPRRTKPSHFPHNTPEHNSRSRHVRRQRLSRPKVSIGATTTPLQPGVAAGVPRGGDSFDARDLRRDLCEWRDGRRSWADGRESGKVDCSILSSLLFPALYSTAGSIPG